jgi:hypothetical protein
LSRLPLCLNRSSIIISNDCPLAKKYLAKNGNPTSRSTNCSSNTNITVSIAPCHSRLPNASEPFCSTSESTMTYLFTRYSVSEPKLRETRLISWSLLPRRTSFMTPAGPCIPGCIPFSPVFPSGDSLSNFPSPPSSRTWQDVKREVAQLLELMETPHVAVGPVLVP